MDDEHVLKDYIAQLHGQHLDTALTSLRHAVKSGDAQQVVMAIPMLLALTICPAMLGTQEAIRQSQAKNKREEHRARRCNLIASCVRPSIRAGDIDGKIVVLKHGKLYIASESTISHVDNQETTTTTTTTDGHPFAGYFLPYPDSSYEGIVSTITEDPPMLNWIYVDRETYEVKHGLRVDAQPHITGPFDCTRQDRRMTLEGWEGFVAVEETPGVWALYFDRDDNGLKGKVPFGTRVLEVELTRREKKERKPRRDEAEATTLDEMMAQHKERGRVEEEEKEQFLGKDEIFLEKFPSIREPEPAGSEVTQTAADDAIPVDWSHLSLGLDNDRESVGSKTAVPSICGDEGEPGATISDKPTAAAYQQPYVEDVSHM
ncbi:uncharacterized protein B0I36DRAFT_331339 [Microdochium trichocladiopsis]|uniref:Uncharacterized protein n=1 Tax=Microdochium trichocladiopsis TaxID=1682393 RepID=A0A9P8XW94_9PEZI|nr:uncharacterized protein B0I36DRAFT_331339 [Microdochium trichocladiopsis]KAH7024389.1 hypothetical protein B0I36DRAFT_331339 [Microdochium trichocladiopsis]